MDIAPHAARKLARRSSRRQFFKFLGAGSLGAGLFLTRTDVSLGAVSGCVGCGGGPCNPCFSPAGRLQRRDRRAVPVQALHSRRRLPRRLQHGRRVVLLPHERGARRLPFPLLGVQLPGRVREPVLPLLHGPPDAVHSRGCTRATSRARARRPSRPRSREPGGLDEPHRRSRSEARPALVTPPVLQAARSGLARDRALPDRHRRLARRDQRLRRLRRRAVQPVRRDRPDLHDLPDLPVQDVRGGRRLRAGLPDLGRVVLLPDLRPDGLPDSLLGVQLPARAARTSAATASSRLPMPCNPRQHSGDQPCTCPPLDAPLPSLT